MFSLSTGEARAMLIREFGIDKPTKPQVLFLIRLCKHTRAYCKSNRDLYKFMEGLAGGKYKIEDELHKDPKKPHESITVTMIKEKK